MAVRTDALEPIPAPEPEEGPPLKEVGVAEWARENLFRNAFNSVLTVVFTILLIWASYRALRFVFVTGRWEVIRANLSLLMVGRFPREEIWRVWTAVYIAAATIGFGWGMARAGRMSEAGQRGSRLGALRPVAPAALALTVLLALTRTLLPVLLTAGAIVLMVVLRWVAMRSGIGPGRWLPALAVVGAAAAFGTLSFGAVQWERWGGLLLTVTLATGGIALSFPIGVLLALGRRSTLPAIRWVSIAYIELIRGVPLVTVLFMAAFVVGFFFPAGSRPPGVVGRAMMGLVAFTAAYIAEIVRGGLQAVPRGQTEAAVALGLSPLAVTRLVVLPQALKAVIPALVGQFISLFKDTSLVVIIGLIELLGVAQLVTTQPGFLAQGLHAEALVFASFIYWTGAYSMSRSSQRLERRLGVGER